MEILFNALRKRKMAVLVRRSISGNSLKINTLTQANPSNYNEIAPKRNNFEPSTRSQTDRFYKGLCIFKQVDYITEIKRKAPRF